MKEVVIEMSNEEKSFQKTNINWFPGHMAKTRREISEQLNLIDTVYEVVDARMPLSSKIVDIDDLIKDKPKILVLTKYDLCDKVETDKIVEKYKEMCYHIVTLDLMGGNVSPLISMTKELMKEINLERSKKGLKERAARVLIMGAPNVGKSTLINRLVGKKSAGVGNTPGFTKNLSWIRINQDIELLDSPGILWPKLDEEAVAFNLASLTSIKEEVLPIGEVVIYILNTLSKYYPYILRERYGIDHVSDDIEDTLEVIGKKRGCIIRGGVVDYDKVYSVILNDIKSGLIKGVTFDRYE
jgi:ribosome biogenesis GTPase A